MKKVKAQLSYLNCASYNLNPDVTINSKANAAPSLAATAEPTPILHAGNLSEKPRDRNCKYFQSINKMYMP
jgi:hypothetical protein